MIDTTFSPEQKDVLQELINLSYGKATKAIAEILDAFATMRVPEVRVVTGEELQELLAANCNNDACFLSVQLFRGAFDGETLFTLDQASAKNLVEHLKEPADNDEAVKSAVAELTNIVTSSLIKEFAGHLGSDVYFNEPILRLQDGGELRKSVLNSHYEHIIVINTVMEFEEQKIKGDVYILTHHTSFEWLKKALDAFLQKLMAGV